MSVTYLGSMAIFRIIIHGFVLSAANMIAIMTAFRVDNALRSTHSLVVQVPVAVILSMVIFLVWILLLKIPFLKYIAVKTVKELSWILLSSLAWGPILFVPLHLSAPGYLTGSGNILSLFQFQLPVNVLAILVAKGIIRPGSK